MQFQQVKVLSIFFICSVFSLHGESTPFVQLPVGTTPASQGYPPTFSANFTMGNPEPSAGTVQVSNAVFDGGLGGATNAVTATPQADNNGNVNLVVTDNLGIPVPNVSDGGDGNIYHPTTTDSNTSNSSSTSSSSGGGDQDNDVPMLNAIYGALQGLDGDTDNVESVMSDLRGTISDESGSRETTLADIYNLLYEEDQNNTDDNASEPIDHDSEEDEVESEIESAEESLVFEKEDIDTVDIQDDFGAIEWKIFHQTKNPAKLNVLDLSNAFDSQAFSLPSIQDAGKWTKRVIVFVVFSLYFMATYNMGIEMWKLLTYSTESNPVSNYAILGNSAGTVAIKTAKITLAVSMVAFVSSALVTAVSDCNFSFDGMDYSYGSVATGISSSLGGSDVHEGFQASVHYLGIFVPLDSILHMSANFLVQKMSIFAGLLVFNRALRMAS